MLTFNNGEPLTQHGLARHNPPYGAWDLRAHHRRLSSFGESATGSDVCLAAALHLFTRRRFGRLPLFWQIAQSLQQARDFMAAEYRTGSCSAVASGALPARRTNRETGIEERKSQEADVAGQAQLPFGFDHTQPSANPAKRRRVLPQPHRRYESCAALDSSPVLHLAFR